MLWTELSIRKPGTPKKHDKPLLEKNFAFCSRRPCFNSHRWLRVCDPGFTASGRVVLSTAASHWWTGAEAWMGRRLPALGGTKMNMDKMVLSQTCRGCKRSSVPKWIKGAERCDLQSCGHNYAIICRIFRIFRSFLHFFALPDLCWLCHRDRHGNARCVEVVDMKRAVPEGDMDSAPTTRRDMARYGKMDGMGWYGGYGKGMKGWPDDFRAESDLSAMKAWYGRCQLNISSISHHVQ